MQVKNCFSIKLAAAALLVTFAVSLQSAEKSEGSEDKNKPGNSNGAVFSDSCGKNSKKKCEKDKKPEIRIPDYSKSIK